MRFTAIAEGAPNLSIDHVIGRDAANHDVPVTIQGTLAVPTFATATELSPVKPNPTNGTTFIQFSLAQRGAADVSIYSVDGRRVKTLAHGIQDAGRHDLSWNGLNDQGTAMKSGVFFVRLETAGLRATRLLMLIR